MTKSRAGLLLSIMTLAFFGISPDQTIEELTRREEFDRRTDVTPEDMQAEIKRRGDMGW